MSVKIERFGPRGRRSCPEEMPERLALRKDHVETFRVVTSSGWTVNLRLMVESDESFEDRRRWASEAVPVHIPPGLSPAELSETDPWERCLVCAGTAVTPDRVVQWSGWDKEFVPAFTIRRDASRLRPAYVGLLEALDAVFSRVIVPPVHEDGGQAEGGQP